MQLSSIIEGISEDLRRAGAVGGEETRRIAELLVASVENSVGLRVLDALQEAARELGDSLPGAVVDVRMQGRDPILSLSIAQPTDLGGREGGEDYSDDELARITLRLPEGLKNQVERAAAKAGASINAWIVSAVARGLEGPVGFTQPARRMPRRMTGYVQG